MNRKNDDLFNMASKKLNLSKEQIKIAEKNGGKELLNKLSNDDKEKINSILNDPQKTKEILSSQKAQALLKAFFGDK
ncbi:MAG: hypothetical protein IJO86_05435 [Oscillospiraceae bacterium]|nr:hypothetical protein [Oscillospiraceae bacterium]